jgi:Holliday junction resolvasome RuvABC endonuclease subunit
MRSARGRCRAALREGSFSFTQIMITTPPTILGLDPGTRFLGAAVLRSHDLLAYGVHQLRNGERPYDVMGQARRVVFRYVEQYAPTIVAIERPYRISTERGAVLITLTRELHERAKELGLDVQEISPEDVRRRVTGNARATKYEVAQALARGTFTQLGPLVPMKPRNPTLWLSSKERYWLHMFDALSLARAVTAYD